MPKYRVCVMALLCVLLSAGCEDLANSGSSWYDGSIRPSISLRTRANGFCYSCTGTVTLRFSPATKKSMRVTARLNASSVSGNHIVPSGTATSTFSISGDTCADPFKIIPSTLTITDPDGYAIEIWDTIDWN